MINYIIKNIKAYPVLKKRVMHYIRGIKEMPEGFNEKKLFRDYLKVRRTHPQKRVSMSEYTIFGFYNLTAEEQEKFLTDTEATLLMRPYNNESMPYLKDKVTFLKTFRQFIKRDWLYIPEASFEEFEAFMSRHDAVALKPPLSSWGIGFKKLVTANMEDPMATYEKLRDGGYLAEEFLKSDDSLACFHPESLNTLRVITFRNGDRFEVFGGGLRTGNKGLHVDNAHGGGIFAELDPKTGVLITDGLDEHGNVYVEHPMSGVRFRGYQIPHWDEIVELCSEASKTLPCLRVVGWDIAILPGGVLEIIEGNHNPGMNIVQAPAKRGRKEQFANMLMDFYGDPAPYVEEYNRKKSAAKAEAEVTC